MFYYLFKYLQQFDVPGASLFNYITFRAAIGFLTAVLISFIFGRKIIQKLQKKQIGEVVRDLGLQGQMQKQGTPTMGGIIIILSTIIPILLFAEVFNIYIIIMLITTVLLGGLGFMDDYIKVFKKHKEGLSPKFKLVAQFSVGLLVALMIIFSNDIKVAHFTKSKNPQTKKTEIKIVEEKSLETTVPFFKNNQLDYDKIFPHPLNSKNYVNYIFYILLVIFIIMAVSNGVNLTDGLDGLASGTSTASMSVLVVFAYVSGNYMLANYLNILYIPSIGEMVVFTATFIGALLGFLWFNTFPAKVFMGDTGSLTIGGIIAVSAILMRKELLIPIFGGIFVAESISDLLQVGYFKYTKRKYGEGRRIFLMAPLHHHYQKKGVPEPRIVTRFIIIAIFLAVVSFITLKVR